MRFEFPQKTSELITSAYRKSRLLQVIHCVVAAIFQFVLRKYRARRTGTLWLLIFNVPFFALLSLRYLHHFALDGTGLQNIYIATTVLGYGFAFFLALSLLFLPMTIFFSSSKIFTPLRIFVFSFFLFVIFIDSFVYDLYKFHLNYLFLRLFFVDYSSFDLSAMIWLIFLGVFFAVMLTECAVVYGIRRLILPQTRQQYALRGCVGLLLGCFLISQGIHIWAYEKNFYPIINITPHLPFYYPIMSHKIMKRFHVSRDQEQDNQVARENFANKHIQYPSAPLQFGDVKNLPNILFIVLESWRFDAMSEFITPNTYKLGAESLIFDNHLSNGSVTPSGIFSLFYGLAPTYWDTVVASNGLGGPVLMQEMVKHQYQFGVFAISDIKRIKIQDTVFQGIENVVPEIDEKSIPRADRMLTKKFLEFVKNTDRRRPFFGALFYYCTHHRYNYPPGYPELFTPAKTIEASFLNNETDPIPFLNRYKNSANFDDSLIGEIVASLQAQQLFDNTIIIITSDHGEEFNENHENYWGHGSNFTKFQIQVPLVIHWPGKSAQRITHRTSHVDLPATLLQEVFQCQNPASDFSSGKSLFEPQKQGVTIASSYFNYAFIQEENVYAIYPAYVKSYTVSDIKQDAPPLSKEVIHAGMEQMNRFFKK